MPYPVLVPQPMTADNETGYTDESLAAVLDGPFIPYPADLLDLILSDDALDEIDNWIVDAATGDHLSIAALTAMPAADRCAFCDDVITQDSPCGWICANCFDATTDDRWEGDDDAI